MKRVFAIDVELCERCVGADHRLHIAWAGHREDSAAPGAWRGLRG
jgi:hypothetical protein